MNGNEFDVFNLLKFAQHINYQYCCYYTLQSPCQNFTLSSIHYHFGNPVKTRQFSYFIDMHRIHAR